MAAFVPVEQIMMAKAAEARLPLIVTGLGTYLTRDGRRVTVTEITPTGCAGTVWKESRGKPRPAGYFYWYLNGRRGFTVVGRKSDIVRSLD